MSGGANEIVSWNIHGLKRKLSDIDFIECIYEYDADIYMFSETWLSDSDRLDLDIQGYTCDHIYGNKSVGAKKGR